MQTHRSTRYEVTIVALLVLFWGIVGLNRIGIGFVLPVIVPEFQMPLWQAGLLISGTSVSWAISSWGGGWLSDRYGRRKVLLPAATLACVMSAAMGATWNFLSLFVVRDVLGLGDGVGWSVGEATIAEESTPGRRGLNQSLFAAGYTLIGAGLGALIITTLTSQLGWRWVFPIIGAVGLLVVAGLFLVMREPLTRHERMRSDWRSNLQLLRGRSVLLLTIMGCGILGWLAVSGGFNVLFLTRVRQFSLVEAGMIASAWGLVGTVGQIVMPILSDHFGRRPVVLASSILCVVCLLAFVFGGFGFTAMAILLGLSGFFGYGPLAVVCATCVSEAVSEDMRGAALGVTNFFGVIVGTSLLPALAGVVADNFGLIATVCIPIVCQAVVALLILGIRETAPRAIVRAQQRAVQQAPGGHSLGALRPH